MRLGGRMGRLASSAIGSRRRRLLRDHRDRARTGCARWGCSRSVSALRDWWGWMFRRPGRMIDLALRVSEKMKSVAPSCLYFEVPLFGLLVRCWLELSSSSSVRYPISFT